MNYLLIAGHLGADPEERFTATGKRVVTLRLAARTRQGGKDETIWYRVNIWGDRFDRMLPYLKKGSGIIVMGELSKPETYVDKEGTTRVSLTVSAETIKFSPFGRSEKPSAQSEGAQQFAPQGQPAFAGSTTPGGIAGGMGGDFGGEASDSANTEVDDLPF